MEFDHLINIFVCISVNTKNTIFVTRDWMNNEWVQKFHSRLCDKFLKNTNKKMMILHLYNAKLGKKHHVWRICSRKEVFFFTYSLSTSLILANFLVSLLLPFWVFFLYLLTKYVTDFSFFVSLLFFFLYLLSKYVTDYGLFLFLCLVFFLYLLSRYVTDYGLFFFGGGS